MTLEPTRVPVTRTLRDVGPINWAICALGARGIRAPQFHLFNAMSRHSLLFWSWLPYSGVLLYWGRLSRRDAEVVILRVGHLRECEYELQQHRRLARSRGVDADLQQKIFEGPDAEGLSDKDRILVRATDEFILQREVSAPTWAALSAQLNRRQLIEFCLLAAQYDGLAATMNTLKLPMDFPD
ncbi:carboxymuconolactone decarboxylase family protein [Mycolicibacterium confluentis]|uniref:4-carboxymuconolactone decarboxylase n=1 Tax=Mycolicibacterium confluentis TaxID=28047 RepID=A0A7I7Y1C9_9MYCO|nr:carboxymuconolactone decarboxylase family protein [Mycolicibacterium confluentis]MCV7320421.1 carboxymuconolactone decarboxylase family protein [Mycolicibacterium confluentis]ORV21859.1 4-carboxymuconolactone decarboxylase [Mycolicibacterium confluentis]BBZ35460.1 4-carboxymuconolactone decarboxylase [Mycolicibacterium confluentis]